MIKVLDEKYMKWERIRLANERCNTCMYDAPCKEVCCKNHCGQHSWCEGCTAECRNTAKLCEK